MVKKGFSKTVKRKRFELPKKGFKSITLKQSTYDKVLEISKEKELTPPEVILLAVSNMQTDVHTDVHTKPTQPQD
jgi:hypothetical protein